MQNQGIVYLLIVLSAMLLSQNSEGEVKFGKQEVPDTLIAPSKKKGKVIRPYEDLKEASVDVKKTRDLIQAIDMILKNDKVIDSKVDLYIKKSSLLYNLGKKIKISVTPESDPKTASFMPYFDQSITIADQLLAIDKKKPVLSLKQKALIHFVRGSINYELNKDQEMLAEYQTSLAFDKTTPQSGSISLIIAEYYFDHDRFDDSILNYQALYNLYDHQQKAIADYKTAWAYLIKKDPTKAEFFFLRAVNAKPAHSLTEDSLRDLAYVSTLIRSEDQNLAFSRKNFTGRDYLRAGYLLALIRHLYAIDKKKIPYKLFNEAFKANRSLKEKAQILGILISYERREYPTKGQIVAFNHLHTLAAKTKPQKVAEMLAEAKQLPDDLEAYIKIFVDGYMQKIRSQRITEKGQFTEVLNKMIPFYLEHFAVEKNLLIYYSLWIDIAQKEEDLLRLDNIGKHWEIQKIKFPIAEVDAKIDNRLRLEIISLLEKRIAKDPSVKPRLLSELLIFNQKYPTDINTLPISKRISDIFLGEGKYREAVPYLKAIYLKEPRVDHFYNLKLAAFQLNDYESITNDPETLKYQSDPKILDLTREAHLKMAAASIAKDDFMKYEESIRNYLKTKPEESKALIVYSDFFAKLTEKKQTQRFCSEFGSMDAKLRGRKEVLKYVESAMDEMIGMGQYFECPSVTTFTSDLTVNYKILLYLRCLGKEMSESELKQLALVETEKRRLLLGLMALSQPRDVVKFFQKSMPSEKEDQRLYFVALKMSQKKDRPTMNTAESVTFKSMMTEEALGPIHSKIDKQISQFFYPTKKMKIDRYSKVMEDVFYRIKVLRKTFVKESGLMPDNQKIQILPKMAEAERKVAKVIVESPRPEGMTAEQLANYDQELTKAAADYENQAEEYLKVMGEIEKRVGDLQAQIEARKVPVIDLGNWPWPAGQVIDRARALAKERGMMAALAYLEYQRNGSTINERDYYLVRGGLLMSPDPHEAIRNYVRDELLAAGYSDVVDQWRKIK